jgi:hypothetical protein
LFSLALKKTARKPAKKKDPIKRFFLPFRRATKAQFIQKAKARLWQSRSSRLQRGAKVLTVVSGMTAPLICMRIPGALGIGAGARKKNNEGARGRGGVKCGRKRLFAAGLRIVILVGARANFQRSDGSKKNKQAAEEREALKAT